MRQMLEPEIRWVLRIGKWATICTVSPGHMPYVGDCRKTAERFACMPEKSPLVVVQVQEMTGRCSAGAGQAIDFGCFERGGDLDGC